MQQLRNQVVKSSMQNQSAAAAAAQNFARVASGRNGAGVNLVSTTDWTSFRNALPSLTNPCRVRKLTKFFGDEPPLVRIFLKKLGYEVCVFTIHLHYKICYLIICLPKLRLVFNR